MELDINFGDLLVGIMGGAFVGIGFMFFFTMIHGIFWLDFFLSYCLAIVVCLSIIRADIKIKDKEVKKNGKGRNKN